VSIAETAAALGAARTDATGQETDVSKVIKQAEQARARLSATAGGATNPLAERAMDSYADAIAKLREGAALLAEVTDVLAEYVRTVAIELPADNVRRFPIDRDHGQPADGISESASAAGVDEGECGSEPMIAEN
jgi:hypothetical protein